MERCKPSLASGHEWRILLHSHCDFRNGGLRLAGQFYKCFFADLHHHALDLSGERKWRLVLVRHGGHNITADVKALVYGEPERHLLFEASFTHHLLAHSQSDLSAGSELVLLINTDLS